MDEQERFRLPHLLNSVEKEERKGEGISFVNREYLRRDLFAGEGSHPNEERFGEESIKRVGSYKSKIIEFSLLEKKNNKMGFPMITLNLTILRNKIVNTLTWHCKIINLATIDI